MFEKEIDGSLLVLTKIELGIVLLEGDVMIFSMTWSLSRPNLLASDVVEAYLVSILSLIAVIVLYKIRVLDNK